DIGQRFLQDSKCCGGLLRRQFKVVDGAVVASGDAAPGLELSRLPFSRSKEAQFVQDSRPQPRRDGFDDIARRVDQLDHAREFAANFVGGATVEWLRDGL